MTARAEEDEGAPPAAGAPCGSSREQGISGFMPGELQGGVNAEAAQRQRGRSTAQARVAAGSTHFRFYLLHLIRKKERRQGARSQRGAGGGIRSQTSAPERSASVDWSGQRAS
jgi:hypothetical protein